MFDRMEKEIDDREVMSDRPGRAKRV